MLLLIRGLPGSGKSTLAKKYKKEENYIHIESDMYFIDNGEYKFDYSKIKEAHEWCQYNTRILLLENKNVVVSNTFIKLWELNPYLKMSKHIKIITCIGNYGNIHNVPIDVLDRMKNNYEKLL